jgi:hypothetical protein
VTSIRKTTPKLVTIIITAQMNNNMIQQCCRKNKCCSSNVNVAILASVLKLYREESLISTR